MLILADDFTGALDTGIQFAKSGARTRVITDTDCDFSGIQAQVLVIDTETRHLRPSEAGNVIGKIVRRAAVSGITFFYKKTDSALRGNAGAEMEALLAASGGKCLHFLPAFPQMNRLVRDGVLYIDSVPVAESVFGKDPFEPVLKSSVPEILAAQTALPVLTADELTEEAEGIIVYNSESQEELRRLCSGIAEAHAASCEIEFDNGYPTLVNDSELLEKVARAYRASYGNDSVVICPKPSLGADDFAFFCHETKALYYDIGAKSPGQKPMSLHSSELTVDERCIKTGIRSEICGIMALMEE